MNHPMLTPVDTCFVNAPLARAWAVNRTTVNNCQHPLEGGKNAESVDSCSRGRGRPQYLTPDPQGQLGGTGWVGGQL